MSYPPPKNKGGNLVLQRICRNSHRFNIEIQILVGKVMGVSGLPATNKQPDRALGSVQSIV
ncbi:hypothetical protein [Leptospira noguchii]|uniref:hypothetical protein n=1 Tax=Leptospira noguchii TaxID=28182 RepID=UPI0018DEE112|nr:hypothetical protein [Leptospira noguchii]UOG41962.1 hypothetical protein MAL05_02310 [Leptospira noguchii]UOG49193.1 hypothetical protein MAL00_02440 [Leptospira noguchii]